MTTKQRASVISVCQASVDARLHPEVFRLIKATDAPGVADVRPEGGGLTRIQSLLKVFAFEEAALICDRIANDFDAPSEISRGAAACAAAIRAMAMTVSQSVVRRPAA